jgi:hypothetical protein
MGRYMQFYQMSASAAPTLSAREVRFGPTAHAVADTFDRVLLSMTAGFGISCLHAAGTRGADITASAWIGLGAAGVALAGAALTTLAAPTIGEITSAIAEGLATRINQPKPMANQHGYSCDKPMEVIRLVPYRGQGMPEDQQHETTAPLFALPDGRRIERAKVLDMIIGANSIGLALPTWRKRCWTRTEWEIGRDLLAVHGLATPRREGQAGKLLVTTRQARGAFGI